MGGTGRGMFGVCSRLRVEECPPSQTNPAVKGFPRMSEVIQNSPEVKLRGMGTPQEKVAYLQSLAKDPNFEPKEHKPLLEEYSRFGSRSGGCREGFVGQGSIVGFDATPLKRRFAHPTDFQTAGRGSAEKGWLARRVTNESAGAWPSPVSWPVSWVVAS